MSYNINPCKAVMQRVKDSNCDINTMNDLCYGISRAYGNVYGSELKYELDQQCAELITDKKCVLGTTNCYLKRPSPPPGFNQVPHFFPQLFKDSNDPIQSYEKCYKMCSDSKYPNSCKENCSVDASAITKNVCSSKEGYEECIDKKCCNIVSNVLILLVSVVFIIFLLKLIKK